jgi:signal transduction histidine kinase
VIRLRRRSLQRRLAVSGFLAVFTPVTILLVVTLATSDTSVTTTPGGRDVEVRTDSGPSQWVPVTAGLLAVPIALGVSWWAQRTIRPLRSITSTIEEIEAGSLDRRLALRSAPGEVQALADSFDRMLDRLSAASEEQQRLVEDASHQLRTPLAAAAMSLDVLIADPMRSAEERSIDLVRAKRSVERLHAIVDDLLADARARGLRAAQVNNDLAVIVRRTANEHEEVARSRGVVLRVDAPVPTPAALDDRSAHRAITNLVDNAVRHSPAGGTVELRVGVEGGRAFVVVEDEGPGIPESDRARLFERGWRGATDRDGHGLGLSIVKQVADAHAGVEVVSPVGPGGGTRVTLSFRR